MHGAHGQVCSNKTAKLLFILLYALKQTELQRLKAEYRRLFVFNDGRLLTKTTLTMVNVRTQNGQNIVWLLYGVNG